jgi:hypothetical protein
VEEVPFVSFLVSSDLLNPNGMIWQESCHIDFVLPPELIIDSGIFRFYCNVLFSLSYVTAKLSPAR